MDIKGHTVNKVMIAQGADIAEEYYFSVLLDRANRNYLAMCSVEGGMEIEQLAVERPEALAKVAIDPAVGIDQAKADEIVAAAGFAEELRGKVAAVILKLWDVFKKEDATLVEVNPLVKTGAGDIVALDGKVSLDENADFRHPKHAALEDKDAADPLEAKAKAQDLNYVKLDGEVGIIGNGAGLVMSTLDVVAYAGENHGNVKPANFLDIGGGASAEVMAAGLDVILGDEQVKSVFVNVFGGITACDAVAKGIVGALAELGHTANKPLVVRLDGNNVEEGRRILAEANHPLVTLAATMDEGADKAAELANAAEVKGPHHVYLSEQGLQGHRPGHHRRRRHQAHRPDAQGRHQHCRRRQRPQGRHHGPARRRTKSPSSAPSRKPWPRPAPTSPSSSSRRPSPRTPSLKPSRPASACVVVITEGVPVQDSAEFWALAQSKVDADGKQVTRIIGPNCPGIITPGEALVGITPANITGKGPIGLVSKSGTLTYQMMYELRDLGFSTAIGIGGDPVIGTTHIDALAAFEADPETKAIVMIGEIGGDAEERAADFIKANVTKPVVGYVAGFTAPEGKTMGHAGAIVSGSAGTAQAKKEALEAAGVKVGKTPSETATLLREVFAAL